MRKGLIATGVLLWLASCAWAADTGQPPNVFVGGQKLLGDESDGSRAHPVHLIPLLDEDGGKIAPDDEPLLPFSTRQTCGACHSYNYVAKGWHFNASDPNVPPGRPGQPWVFIDPTTGTQVPLSERRWPGTFRPEQFGIGSRRFIGLFSRHTPGGGVGEQQSTDADEAARRPISGKLEANCMSCHDADPAHNQAEYALQIARENYRWAAAATSGFALVSGSAKDMPEGYDPLMPQPLNDPKLVPPSIKYRDGIFDSKNQVFFDVVREVPAQRCYFCHSNVYFTREGVEKWQADVDVHLAAGLTCVDCHRNGFDHNVTRGYEGEEIVSKNPLAATSSCQGCHLEGKSLLSTPVAGRLGAPVPKHPGIPPVHFDRLSCTACHSGPWPAQKTYLTKTSGTHRLGTLSVSKLQETLPHIVAPVFAKQANGKIAPHKLIWPAFWGALKAQTVTPIKLTIVKEVVSKVFSKEKLPLSGDWPAVTDEHITEALKALSGQSFDGKAVYVTAGGLYYLDDAGKLCWQENHPAAQPYLWPIAHEVRPAAQAMGVRRCEDCHSPEAPFFFGKVWVDSPVQGKGGVFREMMDMYEVGGPVYVRVNWFFKLLIIVVMTLLIMHILGDLYRRGILWLAKRAK